MTRTDLTPHVSNNVCGQSGKVDTKGLVAVHARLVERHKSGAGGLEPRTTTRMLAESSRRRSLALVKFMLSRFWSVGPAFPKLISFCLPCVQSCVVAVATALGQARERLGSILFIPSTTLTVVLRSCGLCFSRNSPFFSEYDDIYIYTGIYASVFEPLCAVD